MDAAFKDPWKLDLSSSPVFARVLPRVQTIVSGHVKEKGTRSHSRQTPNWHRGLREVQSLMYINVLLISTEYVFSSVWVLSGVFF